MVNYYDLLGVSQDADRATIEQAIKRTRRLWNNRANNPDASIRAEAEQHVREVAEAEKTLLNEAKREEYDQQLLHNPQNDAVDNAPNDNSDWEDEYFRAYNQDMNDYAAQIAQRVISSNERNGRAWFLYGEALRRGGQPEQAINAFQRAAMYMTSSDDLEGVYRQLGFAYMAIDSYANALRTFGNASQISPSNAEYYGLRANCYRMIDMIPEAISEAEKGYQLAPNDNSIRFEYFVALRADALAAMSYNRSSGKHLITNKVQLDYVNGILKKLAQTIPEDANKSQCTSAMDEIVKLVVDAESVKGGFFSSKPGYQYNYDTSNADTRSTGKH